MNLRVMELLDAAHTSTFADPVPTSVRVDPVRGKAILISGHDLKDLEELLKQTEGKGINVYTHGEMLPAHGYPELKKYGHLVGNYGSAWQNQHKEFAAFPGRDCDDDELPAAAGRFLQGSSLYLRSCRLARSDAHRGS